MEEISKSTLGFYLLKSVAVTLSDGQCVRGVLTNLSLADEYLMIGEDRYAFSDVTDVEYVGQITDYHSYQGFGEIEGVTFGLDDFVEKIDPGSIFYTEFENTVACHLGLSGPKIVASKIRILSRVHKTFPSRMASADHLYKLVDGTLVCGRFKAEEDATILKRVGEENGDVIDLSKVIDITRVPQVNEVVGIEMISGETLRGTVSAISADCIVLIGETISMVAFKDIRAIRYTGYVIEEKNWSAGKQTKLLSVSLSPNNKDTVFWMKKTYLRDEKLFEELDAGDEVTFVCGINEKGYIAKDVAIEDHATGERKTGYGVVLFLPGPNRANGFIGKQYMSKGYAQDMEIRMGGGNVSFKMSALNFEFQAGKIYVVKYEYVENEETDVQEALKIDYYKDFTYSEVARINVDDYGNVERLSSAAFYLPSFLECDMKLILTGGEEVNCILKSCDEREITVLATTEEGDRMRTISRFDIENVRYFGYVSIYRMENGTGHINGKYWFHVNDLQDSNEVTELYVGKGVSFSIEQTNKGKLCAAVDIAAMEKRKGILTYYEGNRCRISIQDMFSQDEIVEEYTFTTLNERAWKILESLDFDSYSYPISYSVREETGKIIILNIEQSNRMGKEVTGYLLKYIEKSTGDFGFLVEEKDIESHLANYDRNGTIYFRESDILVNEYAIDTHDKYYRVTFCKDDEGVAKRVRVLEELDFPSRPVEMFGVSAAATDGLSGADGRADIASGSAEKADIVNVSADSADSVIGSAAASGAIEGAAASVKSPVAAVVDEAYIVETNPLAGYNGDASPEELEGARYGFINFANSNFAAINDMFIRKSLITKADYNTPDETVIFHPEQVTIEGESDLKTTRYCYLVRYYPGGVVINPKDHLEYPTVDLARPIVILAIFAKNICHRIEIVGENVVIYKKDILQGFGTPTGNQKKTNVFDAPPLTPGEGAIFETEGKKGAYHSFIREDENGYYVDDNVRIAKSRVSMVHRFGIVSAFDIENGVATINRAFDVSLSVFDPKVINILRNQTTGYRLHVVFGYKDGQIVSVSKIEEDISGYIPWDESIVASVDVEKKYIRLHDSSIHYTSVLTDGMVNRAFKAGTLVGEKVYVKAVNHMCKDDVSGVEELVSFAFEIRLKTEKVTLQYDAGHDSYHGYRNATTSFPVLGSGKVLGKYVGEMVTISFDLGNGNYELEARLEGAEPEEEETMDEIIGDFTDEIEITALDNLLNEKLVTFCQQQADPSIMVMHGIKLNDQGMPADTSQAQRAYDILNGQPGDIPAFMAALIAQNNSDVLVEKSREILPDERNRLIARRILAALNKRSRRIGSDVNYVPGELLYILSVLLRYPARRFRDYLYLIFLQDFASREEVSNFIQSGRYVDDKMLELLFSSQVKLPEETVAHMLMLDQKSLEKICRIVERRPALRDEIVRAIQKIDKSVPDGSVHEMLQELRDRYRHHRSRFAKEIFDYVQQDNISAMLGRTLINMGDFFLEMVCDDDKRIFRTLADVCAMTNDYVTQAGFANQEEQLKNAYHTLCEIEEDIKKHPCKESVEMLLMICDDRGCNVIDVLKDEVSTLLNSLYSDPEAMPIISCFPNEMILGSHQKSFWLIVKNGEKNMKIQTAENIIVKLDSFTEGVSVQKEIKIPLRQLSGGDQCDVEVPIYFDAVSKDIIEIGWDVEFDYTGEFVDGMSRKEHKVVSEGKFFNLQFGEEIYFDKSRTYVNPYMGPAAGQPLEDGAMFFGRTQVMQDIRDTIISEKDGIARFIPGHAVIVHGQKKGGKTSLIYQIKNYIKENEQLNDQAIILNFNNIFDDIGGIELLSNFKRNFYNNILSRFSREIRRNHKDVVALLKEHDIVIPDLLADGNLDIWAAKFDKFFQDFFAEDDGAHTVVLIMDEFTILCTSIMSQIQKDAGNHELANIPNFIKTFSQQYGFVQIIIGHEAMMRVLDTLGVRNHTAEFAEDFEIGALEESASRDLIIKPMEAVFGRNVYGTPLGEKAIEKLLDLSGCNPTYLMRLCNELFEYYVSDRCQNPRIILSDVDNMVRDYVNRMNLEDFDILLVEDGDEISQPERRKTYRYLKCVTGCAIRSSFDGRTADKNQVSKILQEEENWDERTVEEVQTLLTARRVISITDGGRVRINTGLFQNFIVQKMGLD